MWASEPRCDGWAKAWAIVRSSRSKNAHEKSPRVLMLVEYAARRSVAPISSVMASSALRMTSKRTGSMSAASARGGAVMEGDVTPRRDPVLGLGSRPARSPDRPPKRSPAVLLQNVKRAAPEDTGGQPGDNADLVRYRPTGARTHASPAWRLRMR